MAELPATPLYHCVFNMEYVVAINGWFSLPDVQDTCDFKHLNFPFLSKESSSYDENPVSQLNKMWDSFPKPEFSCFLLEGVEKETYGLKGKEKKNSVEC